MLDAIGSDYMYLMMSNRVAVYSLATGQIIHTLNPLENVNKQHNMDNIHIGGQHRSLIISGADYPAIVLYRINDNNDEESRRQVAEGNTREISRFYSAPPELRVRTVHWDVAQTGAKRR